MILMQLNFDFRSETAEPRDDWNQAARAFATKEFTGALAAKRVELIVPNSEDTEDKIAYSIACPMTALLSEPCRHHVTDKYGAEYGVFVEARGYYPKGTPRNVGRTAAGILALPPCVVTALLTYGEAGLLCGPADNLVVSPGQPSQPTMISATISIVDMRTGYVSWLRKIYEGDWRDARSARNTARLLFTELPF
jgi:hypothetical protein